MTNKQVQTVYFGSLSCGAIFQFIVILELNTGSDLINPFTLQTR